MKISLLHIKPIILFLLLQVSAFQIFATHNRAGEITLKQINDLTYEITITTYTYTLSGADRPELEVQWGDNTKSTAPRIQILNFPNDYRRNVYVKQHTYPGPGTYTIVVQDPNRNFGVKNIPNSVNVIFSIKTTISINSQLGLNSTPTLLNPPFDKAGLYQTFIHNPAAFDSDGDSISYSLTVCTQQNGEVIPGYSLPQSSDTLYVDPISGDLVWKTPVDTGIYNIAMNIEEWRKGIKIGNIVRDMQVEVYRTTNLAPVNDSLPKLCVIAGSKILYQIRSTDANADRMEHFITGGPFILNSNPADITGTTVDIPGELTTGFSWQTDCSHVRTQPYSVLVKTNDLNSKLSLVDIDNLDIHVLGPPPQNLDLVPASSLIRIQWKSAECSNIDFYRIYRKTESSGYIPDTCTYGIPSYTGFKLIGATSSGNDSVFIDDNKGKGLLQGTEYCYRIVAVYPDGAESIPSDEACTILVPGSPSILNASVIKSDKSTGEIFLSWAKPLDLDTIPANGPYEYIIYRSANLYGLNPAEIHRFSTSDLNDTVFTDQNINTVNFPYSYSVELYNDAPGNRFLIGKPEIASTTYPLIASSDNTLSIKFIRNVPWLNYENTIYKLNNLTGVYDSIGYTEGDNFADTSLVNGIEYCYQIKSFGKRSINGVDFYVENLSHIACETPIDTIPPCPPTLTVQSVCDSSYNILNWTVSNLPCSKEIVKYFIYYTPQLSVPLTVLDSATTTSYKHKPLSSLAGCYFITAIDSFGNESVPSTSICVDQCFTFDIPNVFTPDGDNTNDVLVSFNPPPGIKQIDFKVFNRWGQLLFETADPDINWDGKIENSNQIASTGVYYYICDVYEQRLSGIEVRNMVGFIHIYSDKTEKTGEK